MGKSNPVNPMDSVSTPRHAPSRSQSCCHGLIISAINNNHKLQIARNVNGGDNSLRIQSIATLPIRFGTVSRIGINEWETKDYKVMSSGDDEGSNSPKDDSSSLSALAKIEVSDHSNPQTEKKEIKQSSQTKNKRKKDDDEVSTATPGSARRSKRLKRSLRDDNSSADADKNGDEEDKTIKKITPRKTDQESRETYDCPHCDKVFKSQAGRDYHVKNSVCRPSETPVKKRSKVPATKKRARPDRFRGTKEDRTCPHCNRVFTSTLGAKYHIEQKVCRRTSINVLDDGKVRPFPTLQPGERFVTPFGVVEVVKDDRAVPTATLPEDVARKHRAYKQRQQNRDTCKTNKFVKVASKLRVRRNAINLLYEKDNANRRTMFQSYFGGDPQYLKSVITANKVLADAEIKYSSKYEGESHPREPKNSFPERIVECIWITDQRSHDMGSDANSSAVKRNAVQGPKKLFLQRRLLTEAYDENDRVYYCPDCGEAFKSQHSRRAHCGAKKCIHEAVQRKEKRESVELRIQREATHQMQFPEPRKYIKKRMATEMVPVTRGTGKKYKAWKKKKKREKGIYPELLLGMGFKLVTKKQIPVPEVIVEGEEHKPIASVLRGANGDVDCLLAGLKATFKVEKRKSDDQKYGSMYAEVYKGLKFRFPGKKKATNVGNNLGPTKRRKRAVKVKPPPPPKPLPPAIDVRALVDEIKSGRYPSVKMFEGDHKDICVLCKQGGDLFCCEYCNNVEHFKCILTKFTIKLPEPDEDFMCHKCIGIILSRRARAEKRRLQKQAKNEQQKKEQEALEAVNNPSKGNEYPYMAQQAREVNELVELLKDSQIRLRRSIETTKLNNIRRRAISNVYPEQYEAPYF